MSGFEILAPPSSSMAAILVQIPTDAHARFKTEMLPALWDAAMMYQIDPVGMVAQSGHETGWGRFTGKVKPFFFNTCGLKVKDPKSVVALFGSTDEDHSLAHDISASWLEGAIKHAQHLRAYCNEPVNDLILDPRYEWVIGNHNAVRWADLSGRWATPGIGYGEAIERTMVMLREE